MGLDGKLVLAGALSEDHKYMSNKALEHLIDDLVGHF